MGAVRSRPEAVTEHLATTAALQGQLGAAYLQVCNVMPPAALAQCGAESSAEPIPAHAQFCAGTGAGVKQCPDSLMRIAFLRLLVPGCCRVGAAARRYRDSESPSCSRSAVAARAFTRLGDGAGLGLEGAFANSPGWRANCVARSAVEQL